MSAPEAPGPGWVAEAVPAHVQRVRMPAPGIESWEHTDAAGRITRFVPITAVQLPVETWSVVRLHWHAEPGQAPAEPTVMTLYPNGRWSADDGTWYRPDGITGFERVDVLARPPAAVVEEVTDELHGWIWEATVKNLDYWNSAWTKLRARWGVREP